MDLEQWLQSVRDAENCSALPFIVREERVQYTPNSSQIKKWYLYMATMTVYIIFILLKGASLYHQMNRNGGTTPFHLILDFNLCLIVVCTVSAEMLLHILTLLGKEEVPLVVNAFIDYVEYFSGTFPLSPSRISLPGVLKELQLSKYGKLVLDLIMRTGSLISVSVMIMSLLNPGVVTSPASKFVTSSFPNRVVVSILTAIFFYLIVSRSWQSAKFYILATLHIPLVLGRIHGQLFLNLKKSWTSPKLRTPANLILHFRCIQVLQMQFQQVTGHYFLPMQFLITRVIIGTVFLLIRYHKEVHPIMLFGMGGTMGVMNFVMGFLLVTFGRVQFISRKCIVRSWRHRHWVKEMRGVNEEHFRRVVKSCKPIAIHFGVFYAVKPKTLLRYMISIARGTVRLLIATRSRSH